MTERSVFSVFQQRLQNLSAANRNLFLPRLINGQMLDLTECSFLLRHGAFTIVESLIRRKAVRLCAYVDSRDEATNRMSAKLSRLLRHVRYITEEKGTHDLYLAWPFVTGRFRNDTGVRAPLLFFPAELELRDETWWLTPVPDQPVQVNPTFLLAYAWHNQLPANTALMEWEYEETADDALTFINRLYHLISETKLELDFNADTFLQQLKPFTRYTKLQFDAAHQTGRLQLHAEAVLGIFPPGSSTLAPDYEQLLQRQPGTSLTDFFHQHFSTQIKPGVPREEDTYAPFRLDGWQENALLKIKAGQSMVVKGPPGTGKSQLISNLVCDAVANRKRVLVVSQKRVALEVVHQRLHEEKVHDFVALVHDYQHDRAAIYNQIARQIDRVDEYKQYSNSIDSIQLEREFVQIGRRLDTIKEQLEEFREELYRIQACGLSAKELYLQADPAQPALPLDTLVQHFPREVIPNFLNNLRRWELLTLKLETPQHPWFHRTSLRHYAATRLPEYRKVIEATASYAAELPGKSAAALGQALTWAEAFAWQPFRDQLKQLGNLAWQPPMYTYFQAMSVEAHDEISLLWLSNEERVLMECFEGEGLEETTPSPQLGQLQLALERANRARTNIFRLMWWELFGAHRVLLKRTLIANGLPGNKGGLLRLEQRVDNRLNFEHHQTKLRQRSWLLGLPSDYKQASWRQWFAHQLAAARAYHAWAETRGLRNFIHPHRLEPAVFADRVLWVFHQLGRQHDLYGQVSVLLSDYQINQLVGSGGYAASLLAKLEDDGEELAELDRLQEAWQPEERELITRWVELQGSWTDKVAALNNGWALAWLKQIELQRPLLRAPSTGQLTAWEEELQELIERQRLLTADLVVLRARDRILEDWVMNRLNNRVTFRDLYHQVTKRRKIWPLRKTIAEFEDELFRLIPVWLASPEATSALFPLVPLFDLVIFDEASQCFPEQALPAMYRGRQVVVAGDEQQLRPHQGYAIRWSEEEGDDEDHEVESFLDLALRHFPHTVLQGHYRSQSPLLIAFSNLHFYKNQLMMLPAARLPGGHAIQVRKVAGIWQQNTNPIEAQAVVDLVLEVAIEHPKKTVGVITFNAPQQDLIEELLQQQEPARLPAALIVKNIENVQGDERDIVIFSIGYAPDEKGHMTAQFGSLNVQGGENRLNVAVTRAREAIWVVTSIMANQLQVEGTRNLGPKLLKAYLEFAVSGALTPAAGVTDQQERLSARLQQIAILQTSSFPFGALLKTNVEGEPALVLTDDQPYHQHPSAKSWHAYVPLLLQEKEWKRIAVYSRQFCFERKKVEAVLG
jgi:hypothetical protein